MKKGVTLIEVLIAAAITGIAVALLGIALMDHGTSSAKTLYDIKQFDGGRVIGSWTTDNFRPWFDSSLIYFIDSETNQLIYISGNCQIIKVGSP